MLGVLSFGLFLFGRWLLFTTFMVYDDEGYVLISLKAFAEGGSRLYDSVYSQYGPLFFLSVGGLFDAFGLPFDNTTGRSVTLVLWAASAGFCAALVWRLTRDRTVALFTLVGTFLYLWPIVREPLHPGAWIVCLIAASLWGGSRLIAAGCFTPLAFLFGASGAALLLIKINVGVFFLAGAGAWMVVAYGGRGRTAALILAGVALTALPFLLMRELLAVEWVRTFAIASGAAAGPALLTATLHGAHRPAGGREIVVFGAGFLAVTAGVLAVVLAQGTSWDRLLAGVLLEPLRHPHVYRFPLDFPQWTLAFALFSIGLFAVCWFFRRRGAIAGNIVVGLRYLLAAGYVMSLFGGFDLSPFRFVYACAIPAVWALLWPLASLADRSAPLVRNACVLLLIPQSLHAYPVAGSQLSWGTFLIIPILAVAVLEAIRRPRRESAGRFDRIRNHALSLAPAGLLMAVLLHAAHVFNVRSQLLHNSVPLGIPGAERIEVREDLAAAYRAIVANGAVHSGVLFSLPGMYSFNLWTDRPTPTDANATHWFTLLSSSQQESIRARLESDPRACVVVQTQLVSELRAYLDASRSPLLDYLESEFQPLFRTSGFEFRIRNGRSAFPLYTAEILRRAPSFDDRQGAEFNSKLVLRLGSAEPQTIREIEIIDVSRPDAPPFRLAGRRLRIEAASVDSAGNRAQGIGYEALPVEFSGLVELHVYFDSEHGDLAEGSGVVRSLGTVDLSVPIVE